MMPIDFIQQSYKTHKQTKFQRRTTSKLKRISFSVLIIEASPAKDRWAINGESQWARILPKRIIWLASRKYAKPGDHLLSQTDVPCWNALKIIMCRFRANFKSDFILKEGRSVFSEVRRLVKWKFNGIDAGNIVGHSLTRYTKHCKQEKLTEFHIATGSPQKPGYLMFCTSNDISDSVRQKLLLNRNRRIDTSSETRREAWKRFWKKRCEFFLKKDVRISETDVVKIGKLLINTGRVENFNIKANKQ